MSYRKHGVRIESCFKETALKYVDTSIKLSPYRWFCCPVSLISTSSSANIPVSSRFFGEFDGRCLTPRHFEIHSVPVLLTLPKTPQALHSQGNKCHLMAKSFLREKSEPTIFGIWPVGYSVCSDKYFHRGLYHPE